MKSRKEVVLASGLVVLAALSGLAVLGQTKTAAKTQPSTQPSGKIAATVNGTPILESELLAGLPEDAFDSNLEEIKQSKLKRLVGAEIQAQFLAKCKVTVSEQEMAKGLEDFKTMIKTPGCPCCGGGYESLDQFMKANAFTMDEVRQRVKNDVGFRLYCERLVNEELSPRGLAEAIKKRRPQIEKDFVRAHAILFECAQDPEFWQNPEPPMAKRKALADKAWKRLENKEPFEKVAKEMSEHKESASKGGALGCVRVDFLGPEAEEVFRKLEPGAYSGVVKTVWGCCVVMRAKLTEEDILFVVKEQAKGLAEDQAYHDFKAAGDRAKIQYCSASASAPAPS